MRPQGRANHQIRELLLQRKFTRHAEGSVLISMGETKVLCSASVEVGVPRFLQGSGKGWVTAEYGMLPRATHTRNAREAARGKQTGRTSEIQRLIGRSLRAVVDLTQLGEHTITLDCDVIQADGGTRTAAISGAYVALVDAIEYMLAQKMIKKNPLKGQVAAISVGVVSGETVCDLEYVEDSAAETDMNVVMTEGGRLIEIQGTAEEEPFSRAELNQMLDLAEQGITTIFQKQQEALNSNLQTSV